MNNPNESPEFNDQIPSEPDHAHRGAPAGHDQPDSGDDDILELGHNFDFEGFQVVRREFFAHTYEPAVSFNNCKFYVNSACLQKFPDSDHVQVLVNKDTKILAIMPCPEAARDSFAWCTVSKGKRKPRQITAKLFFAKVAALMDWNPDYRYKILGKQIHANGEYLLAFDLTATEIYQRTFKEGSRPKTSRIPVFPAEWQNQFGLPYNEHRQSLQVNILDGYAVYSITDNTPKPAESEDKAASADVPVQQSDGPAVLA